LPDDISQLTSPVIYNNVEIEELSPKGTNCAARVTSSWGSKNKFSLWKMKNCTNQDSFNFLQNSASLSWNLVHPEQLVYMYLAPTQHFIKKIPSWKGGCVGKFEHPYSPEHQQCSANECSVLREA